MCRQNQNCCTPQLPVVEEAISAEERLLIYCKPVELYNILHCRSLHNPIFLSRNLDYKIQATGKRKRVRAGIIGIIIFNYKDHNNMLQKTEVTEDYSCPFCLMQCASYKGLRHHLCSSHDLFNFEFWATEEYQAVNVAVKINTLRCETVAGGIDPRLQTFSFRSKSRKRARKTVDLNEKQSCVQFLELDSCALVTEELCPREEASKSIPSDNGLQNGRHGAENGCFDYSSAMNCNELVSSSSIIPGVSIAMAQSPVEPECVKTTVGSDNVFSAVLQVSKAKKTAERSDPKNRMLLQRRQFYHSHRVQPMAMEQVMSDLDSEDELDDEIADFEDRRMLDDFVDVSKDEKQLMHLWNSFVRKQSVLADGHIPWACEAFSKLHGRELVHSTTLFWCWRLFMIKLWNHGLLDAGVINNCNIVLERCRSEGSDALGSQMGRSKSTEIIQGFESSISHKKEVMPKSIELH